MEPIWKKRNELLQNPDILFDIVNRGTEKARKVAAETMHMVRETMGLY
jgi:tryptophanyl-tRNA synthetase